MKRARKALLLSVGYGGGHNSAAQALAEEMKRRGWRVKIADVCAEAKPRTFRLTQRFYHFCVRYLPWVWGAVYRQLDAADWASMIRLPGIAACTRRLKQRLKQDKPHLIVCTYPLFAYMLDALAREGELRVPYAVVVTDALEISRPWVQTGAALTCLPDEHSLELVQERYALPPERLAAPGFPVRADFTPGEQRPLPGTRGEGLHIVYSCHAPLQRIAAEVQALLREWPEMRLSLLGEERAPQLRALLPALPEHVTIYGEKQDMAALLRTAHFYIGKAGAATMFEAYSAEVPVLVNHSLPGQEEGNLQLLLKDGAGKMADSPEMLLEILRDQLVRSAAGWQQMRRAMAAAHRSGGAARTVDMLERRFFS